MNHGHKCIVKGCETRISGKGSPKVCYEHQKKPVQGAPDENMKNPQPFITTDEELRKEFLEEMKASLASEKAVKGMIYIADFWLQKMSEHKERLIKEVGDMKKLPYSATLCQNRNGLEYCGTCEQAWEQCSCSARNTGYKKALEDILRRLQSV